jgi:hypothetical protein
MTIVALRSAQAGAILTALGLSAGLMTGPAQAVPVRAAHSCTSPIFQSDPPDAAKNWVDLNLRYNVKERIIGPPGQPPLPGAWDETDVGADTDISKRDGCLEAFVGERWVRAVPPWITATPTEQKAFIDNFLGARYVIDGGTDKEQTVTAGPEILRKGNVPDLSNLTPTWTQGKPFVVPVSPIFDALPSGNHTSILYVTMSQQTCNGLTTDIVDPPNAPGLNQNCLPAGESPWPITAAQPAKFTVSNPPPAPTAPPGG